MKILVLGAGQVGRTVAGALSRENNDITVVDRNRETLATLEERLDIKTVHGHASHPDVLIRAGAEDADLILAVTDSDETNMIACQVAYTLFQTPVRLARVRSSAYQKYEGLFGRDAVPITHIINPETLLVNSITHLVEQTEALQILDFAEGCVHLVAVKAHVGGPLVGNELRHLSSSAPARIVAIYRGNHAIDVEDSTVVEANDEVFFFAASEDTPAVLKAFGRETRPTRRVIIAGGGRIGLHLASRIESSHLVKVIECDRARCEELSRLLPQSIILHGDVSDASLLKDEVVGDSDMFCAVTNDDETNILSAILAKRCGVSKSLAIINNPDYLDIIQGDSVDIALSPASFTIGAILTHTRRGDVLAVHSLRRGVAEAIEIIAHGNEQTSRVVGRNARNLPLPEGTSIGAVIRKGELLFVKPETVIRMDDRVILFLQDKNQINEVETLFQVESTFL
ncbi:MAG: Trk system potassium transporter TrkA [Lysobacterales bacterium]|jgi:trk system potassium uptake protein TrkA